MYTVEPKALEKKKLYRDLPRYDLNLTKYITIAWRKEDAGKIGTKPLLDDSGKDNSRWT